MRRSISLVSLLAVLLILAVPVALLVFLLVHVFVTPTITRAKPYAPIEQGDIVCQLAWQEPFSYEAKVYASLSPDFSSNDGTFFESAKLLWHVEPQDIGKKYPVFRRKLSVHIPSELRSGLGLHQGLYAHIFIQQSGRFSPHPDLTDPYLVSSKIPLVQWSDKYSTDVEATKALDPSDKEHAQELVGVSSASWAIILENHTYLQRDAPSYLQITSQNSHIGTYNPLLLPNTFTKGWPEKKPLATLKDKLFATDVYQQTIDVEFELLGIREGWVSAKTGLVDYFVQRKPKADQTIVPNPSTPEQYRTSWVRGNALAEFDRVYHFSIPALLYMALCIALFFARAPASIRLLMRLLSMPAARWIGVSRATISIMLIAYALSAMKTIARHGIIWLVFCFGLFFTIYIAAGLDDMTLAPWAALVRLIRRAFQRKPSSDFARSSSAQQLAHVAKNFAESGSTEASTTSNSYFRRPESIISIRRSVDEIAMRWIHLLSFPVIAIVALYMFAFQQNRVWSAAFVAELLSKSSHAFFYVAWLPQIVVNYKAKSGSLTPVMYNVIVLSGPALLAIFAYLVGATKAGNEIAYSIPIEVCHIVIIIQRFIYYTKPKKE